MRFATLLALLPAVASAHFTLNVPKSRGNNDESQSSAPCGGLNTPSAVRDKWPITGGQVKFEAGHDEANTVVKLSLSNNPGAGDFNIVLKEKFLQIGLGTFCWNELPLPKDVKVTTGQNATIQVIQEAPDGQLYNCADIVFTDAVFKVEACSNGTGVTAEPASSTNTAAGAKTSGNAGNTLKVAGSVLVAGVVGAAAAWML